MMCQPLLLCWVTQVLVRFGCEHAMLVPPMYTPAARKGDLSQSDIWLCEGVWHASNPRPVKMPPGVPCVAAAVLSSVWSWGRVAWRLALAAGARRTVKLAPAERSERTDSARRISAGSRFQVAV